MDRERRILSRLLNLSLLIMLLSCCSDAISSEEMADVSIVINNMALNTKAELPDEEKISDISILIFDSYGMLEKSLYLTGGQQSCTVNLLKDNTYSIFACINFGYQVQVKRLEDTKDIEYHLAYPDEYREGVPMAAALKDILITQDCSLSLEAERLMARISLKMDRGKLSDGVKMNVIGVRIGNCPKKVTPFTTNRVAGEDDCFRVGFRHDELACHPLNRPSSFDISEELSLYMLENMQGTFSSDGLSSHQEKVFKDSDARARTCSFIEIEMEYSYADLASVGHPLIYRFYLGENLNSLDIERNCHYHITISPEDDGLKGDGWRVDKSSISFVGEPGLIQYPSDYIRGDIGDVIHLGCTLTPDDTPFDIGLEYLEDDKAEGIYDYVVDEDGHGVTLTLTGSGTGLIYMEAGEPINDAALFLIEVNL